MPHMVHVTLGCGLPKTPLLRASVNRTLDSYPEQVEYQDHQPSRYPADGTDDDGEEVNGHVIGQAHVGQEQKAQPEDRVGYEPAYELHTVGRASNACRPNLGLATHRALSSYRPSENPNTRQLGRLGESWVARSLLDVSGRSHKETCLGYMVCRTTH